MEITLIRHGMTEGNKEHRFIGGRTDEPICAEGREVLLTRTYEYADILFVSPMKRCIQTADIIFPNKRKRVIESFRECDFGMLEGKNHQELEGTAEYERFIKSDGKLPFPGGEAVELFNQRCINTLTEALEEADTYNAGSITCVVHGGTIMAVMDKVVPESAYYDWNVKNGEGYRFSISLEQWRKKQYGTALIGSIEHRIYH